MTKKLDDIYVFTFFDETQDKEQEIGTAVANSIEELQEFAKAVKILTYVNITGTDIKVGKPNIMNYLVSTEA